MATWYQFGGRQRVRIRDTHIRDHYAPLLADGAHGVVKLDLVLRGLASLPGGGPEAGQISADLSWQYLHDFCRGGAFYGDDLQLKRKWVSDKLARLEKLRLIDRRTSKATRRPRIFVLSDKANGEAFDDPGSSGDGYVTLIGDLVDQGHFATWTTARVAAYLAAMTAERYARADSVLATAERLGDLPFGGGRWFRALDWFRGGEQEGQGPWTRLPFSTRTLRRGIRELRADGLMAVEWIHRDPRNGRQFPNGPRVMYYNGFDDVRFSVAARRRRLGRLRASASAEREMRYWMEWPA